jgi:hypothetical protein
VLRFRVRARRALPRHARCAGSTIRVVRHGTIRVTEKGRWRRDPASESPSVHSPKPVSDRGCGTGRGAAAPPGRGV